MTRYMCRALAPHIQFNVVHNIMTFRPTDSYGHIDPDMKPLWHLGIVASSFVMLNESTENTLYNMAQVANFTQLVGCFICCWVCSLSLVEVLLIVCCQNPFTTVMETGFFLNKCRNVCSYRNENKKYTICHICIDELQDYSFACLLQPTENDQLKFDYHILLHEMVSQVNRCYDNIKSCSSQLFSPSP